MKYFLDTEFIEDGKTIDLISIGIVAEDNRSLYLINSECDWSKASPWVLENVLEPMGIDRVGVFNRMGFESPQLMSPTHREQYNAQRTRSQIRDAVLKFIAAGPGKPEFWGYYCDYDWVVFCQLFGTMMELPKGYPMYMNDLKQLLMSKGNPLQQKDDRHNALTDAYWIRDCYESVTFPATQG